MLTYNDNMQKDLIKSRFKKSLKTYETNAVVQRQMATHLAGLIDMNFCDSILELGCGTGFLTKEVIKNIDFNSYYAVDIVEDCKNYIGNISEKIQFICEDIEGLDIDIKPNLIISNASFQWIENFPEYADKINRILPDGGSFVFSLFGEDNYKEITNILPNKLNYLSPDKIKDIFKIDKICHVQEERIVLNFDSPIDVLYHMKYTGVNALKQVKWTKHDLAEFEKQYKEVCGEKITLTYHPIYVKVAK